MTTEQIPFFVYGTLRRGFGNYNAILAGNTDREVAALADGVIYPVGHYGGFPCLMEEDGTVVGELMYIKPDRYDEMLQRMDRLEGYRENSPKNSMYIRKQKTARTNDGLIDAWVYVWNGAISTERIKGGCWKTFTQKRAAEYLDEMYNDDFNHI